MSGVLGIVDARGGESVASLIARMAEAICHRPWHVADTYVDPDAPVALGRVRIGVFNREAQPYRSDDGDVVAFFTGVLSDEDPTGGHAQRIATLYREHGPLFARHLRGEFLALIWDRARQELLLTNDRCGSYPMYYACDAGRLLFAPEVKALTGPADYPVRFDVTALAEYMRFQNLLGERTFVEGIRLLPYASALRFMLRSGALSIEAYWHLGEISPAASMTFPEAVREATRLLVRAVNRAPARHRTALYLTGGLDSRLLLGLVDERHRPMTTITFGEHGSRDVVYGRRLAQLTKSRHHHVAFDNGQWVADGVDLHLTLTEGFHGWVHAHGVSTLPLARSLADVVLTGCGGGSVLGGWLNSLSPLHGPSDDVDTLAVQQFHRFNQRYAWPGLTEAEEEVLYCEPLRHQMRGRAFDSLRTEVARYMNCRPELRGEMLYLRNHDFRMIHNTVVMMRSYVEACSPYFDDDVLQFVYALPNAVRGYKRLLRAMLQAHAPRLSYVPHARDGFLPTTHAWAREPHAWLVRLARKINAHIAPVFPEPATTYADYERYIRTDLRVWAEDLLVGARTCDRGLFNPAFLRALWARLQRGREPDIIGKAAPIMTYELMLRRFYD